MNGNRMMQAIMCLIACAGMTLFFSSGTIAEDIQETIDHEAGFYYTIQRGDTLWDLSDKFFDTPWFWPELWQENDQIPNPHWIYPGERIRLFQKKGQDTFTLNIPEPETLAQESSSETELDKEGEQQEEAPPAVEKETVYYLYPSIDMVGFIRKEAVHPLGLVAKVKDDKKLVSKGDIVYITYVDKEALPIMQGSQYTVYRKLKPTKDRKMNKALGGQYYVLGIVEVTRMEEDFVIAKVIKSFRHMQIGDFILPYSRRSPKIPIADSVDDLVGKILLSEEHQKIIGDFTIAFIDKGKDHNVGEGQIYSIFYEDQESVKIGGKKSVIMSPVDYGKLIVLHSEKQTSTVLITQTDQDAPPGALIRTPVPE